jgi:hypothetical protein
MNYNIPFQNVLELALTRLKTIGQPVAYHGFGHTAGYFEGWYFKIVDPTEQRRYAIIPGVFLGKGGVDSHSFVQTLDGARGTTRYHRYPLEAFSVAPAAFDICVGPNRFTAQGIELNIDRSEQRIIGRLAFDGVAARVTVDAVLNRIFLSIQNVRLRTAPTTIFMHRTQFHQCLPNQPACQSQERATAQAFQSLPSILHILNLCLSPY